MLALGRLRERLRRRRRLRRRGARRRRRRTSLEPSAGTRRCRRSRSASRMRRRSARRRFAAPTRRCTGGWIALRRARGSSTPPRWRCSPTRGCPRRSRGSRAGRRPDRRPDDPLPRAAADAGVPPASRCWRVFRSRRRATASSRRTASCGRPTARCSRPVAPARRCSSLAHEPRDRVGYLGLGSNVGDRRAQLQAAPSTRCGRARRRAPRPRRRTRPTRSARSSTSPHFLNACVRIETDARPRGRCSTPCKAVERELGREPPAAVRHGPRPIDVDMLLLGDASTAPSADAAARGRCRRGASSSIPLLELDLVLRTPDGTRWRTPRGAAGRRGRAPRRAAAQTRSGRRAARR